MKPSSLHLEGYHVAEFAVKLNDAFEKKTVFGACTGYHYQTDKTWKVEPTNFTVDAELSTHIEDDSRFRYVLKIASTGRKDQFPYSFRISLVGYFHIEKSFPEEHSHLLIYASAPSLLYASAREMLANTTGRGPFPAVILPTASFVDDAQVAADEAAQKTGSPLLKGKSSKKARVSRSISTRRREGGRKATKRAAKK